MKPIFTITIDAYPDKTELRVQRLALTSAEYDKLRELIKRIEVIIKQPKQLKLIS